MYEELKTALELCTADHACCDDCKYLDTDDCDTVLKCDALAAIKSLENGVQYLSALNTKLAEELQESLNLKTKKGKWIYEDVDLVCSECRHDAPLYYGNRTQAKWDFCPNCGADMRCADG